MIHVDTDMDLVLYHFLEDNSECERQHLGGIGQRQLSGPCQTCRNGPREGGDTKTVWKTPSCQTSQGCSRMVTERETRTDMLSYQVDDSLCVGSNCMLIGGWSLACINIILILVIS